MPLSTEVFQLYNFDAASLIIKEAVVSPVKSRVNTLPEAVLI